MNKSIMKNYTDKELSVKSILYRKAYIMISADLSMGRSNLDEFSATIIELAEKNRDIITVTSDSRGSGKGFL